MHQPAQKGTEANARKEVTIMAARSSWKGFLRLSLVAVPVKAYPATVSGGGG